MATSDPDPIDSAAGEPSATPLAMRLAVRSEADVEVVRRAARALAQERGLPHLAVERFVLAVSELAMNLARYAREGEIVLRPALHQATAGVEAESHDAGPGIPDLALAFQDGYTTGGGLGCGLPGARRLVDEFSIETSPAGTHIVAVQWATPPSR